MIERGEAVSPIGSGLGRGEGRFGKEDADRERGHRIDVDVFGRDPVGEGRVRGGDGFVGSGRDAEGVGWGMIG